MATDQTLNIVNAFATYANLYAPAVGNALADHILVHQLEAAGKYHELIGDTPYPDNVWQSFENLQKEKDKQRVNAETKVKVQKTKEVVAEDGSKKKVKVEGEFEEKDKRLAKPTTINASAKGALMYLVSLVVHEAACALPKIARSDADSIKGTIVSNANENAEYCFSNLLFQICETVDDKVVSETFPVSVGGLRSKLDTLIEKFIKNDDVRHVVVTSLVKFMYVFTVFITSVYWHETKESENEDSHERTFTGKGITTTLKQIKQFLFMMANLYLPMDERPNGSFYSSIYDYCDALQEHETKRKAANKAAKDAKAASKPAADNSALVAATAEPDDDPLDKEVTPAPAPAPVPVPTAAAAPAAAQPAPTVDDAVPVQAPRRRRAAK